mmetsp:Transcript_14288/g.15462  ORF Transcript_14288/g.15462 Transcript_14288/m.15462 type:complete len:82 (+) Transcript_14288:176-421(+)
MVYSISAAIILHIVIQKNDGMKVLIHSEQIALLCAFTRKDTSRRNFERGSHWRWPHESNDQLALRPLMPAAVVEGDGKRKD